MLAVNYTNLRDNMKRYMDQVTDDYETMIVTRKNNKNVVILSEETYNNLMESLRHSWKMDIVLHMSLLRWRMNKVFTENGWADYTFWETEDRKTLKKINKLIEDICQNGNEGIGKPEALSGNLAGYWSRRINDKDRLIYKIDENNVYILACRYHYSDK